MSESRSDKEMAGYTSLKAKLEELTAKLKSLDHSGAESLALGFFESAIRKLQKECDKAVKKPSELWDEARAMIKAFTDKYMKQGAAATTKSPLDGFELGDLFAAEAEPAKRRTPPPLPPDYMIRTEVDVSQDAVDLQRPVPRRASQTMFVQDVASSASAKPKAEVVKQTLPKDIVMMLDDRTGEEELSAELVRNLDKESPEVVFMVVNKMIDDYIGIINKFIPEADNYDRKSAAKQLLANLTAVKNVLNSDASMTVKAAAVRLMKAHFTTAANNSSLDGKDLLKRTATSKIFRSNKVSVVSIFGRWHKEQGPLDSMMSTVEDKLRKGSPSSKSGANG